MSGYFDEQIAAGKPIVPPTSEQAPSIANEQKEEDTPEKNKELSSVEKAQLAVKQAQEQLEAAQKEAEKPVSKKWIGLPVRGDGDKVFLLRGGKKHWITSPKVYEALGFKFGDEGKLDEKTLQVIPEGEPLR